MIAAVGDCLEEVTDVRSGIQRIVVVGNDPVWIPARAISLRQPWAYLMLALPEAVRKDIENRTTGFRSINFRGPVWVHASGRPLRKQYEAAVIACRQRGVPEQWIPTWNQTLLGCRHGLESGSIVGQFCIDDYLAPTSTPKARWLFPNQHGFITSEPRVLRAPVSAKGHLGFWRVDNDLAKNLAARVKYPRCWHENR